jgi:hypothetical protein
MWPEFAEIHRRIGIFAGSTIFTLTKHGIGSRYISHMKTQKSRDEKDRGTL